MLNIEVGKMVKYHDQKWLIEGISDGYALLKAGHKKRKVKLEVLRYLELRDHQRNRAQ
jgi:hypothetical protein